MGHVTSCCRRGVTTFACFPSKLGMLKTGCACLTWRRMCSSAHFSCRDCSDARGWGLGCKDIICSFGKISNAGRRISGKHNTNGLWKLPQEKGAVNHGLLVISCSVRFHISEEARWFAVTQTGNSKVGSILVSLSEAKKC